MDYDQPTGFSRSGGGPRAFCSKPRLRERNGNYRQSRWRRAFAWSPRIGATGNTFTFNSLTVAEFATATASAGSFNEIGFLSIIGANNGSNTLTPTGLGGTTAGGGQTSGLYTLYLAFSASGTSAAPDFNTPSSSPYSGNFNSLSYTLYGVNGQSTFSFVGSTPFVANSSAPVVLATGALVPGSNQEDLTVSLGGTPSSGSMYQIAQSASNLNLEFVPNTAESGFFVSPTPFMALDLIGDLTAGPSVVTLVNPSTIEINNGRGTLATPAAVAVPEPASIWLLAASLGSAGLIVLRRRRKGSLSRGSVVERAHLSPGSWDATLPA